MPDTGAYLILGLAATALIMGALIASFVVRHRNLTRDIELLRKLADDKE
jgi:hypothetical protein